MAQQRHRGRPACWEGTERVTWGREAGLLRNSLGGHHKESQEGCQWEWHNWSFLVKLIHTAVENRQGGKNGKGTHRARVAAQGQARRPQPGAMEGRTDDRWWQVWRKGETLRINSKPLA